MTREEAQQRCAWPCGHPRTDENTYEGISGCAECWNAKMKAAYRAKSPERRRVEYLKVRKRMMPDIIARAERRVQYLRNEAERLGVVL